MIQGKKNTATIKKFVRPEEKVEPLLKSHQIIVFDPELKKDVIGEFVATDKETRLIWVKVDFGRVIILTSRQILLSNTEENINKFFSKKGAN